MQPSAERRGKARPRILYWFRTPPNVKVGREAFAEHVRRGLEAHNPDVRFDWDALVATPIPPPDADRWRERRRAARAARQAAEAESAAVEEADATEGGREGARESFAVSAPEGSQPAPSTPELQTTSEPRRRRRRRRRHRAQPAGHEAAPPVDEPDGG